MHLHQGQARAFKHRAGLDQALPQIAYDASEVDASSAIIDGEGGVPSADGVTDFSLLQNELKGRSTRIVLAALTCFIRMDMTCEGCRC